MVDEIAILLAETEIGAYIVKPWSFGKFKKVYPALAGIIPALKDAGVTVENVQEILSDRGLEIVGAVLPSLTSLIALTLDISEEEVENMDFGQAAAIGLTIISQNIEQIKNFLPLIVGQFQAMSAARGNGES